MIALRKIVLNKSGLSLASLQVTYSESMEAKKKNGKIWPSFFTMIALRKIVLNKSGLSLASLQGACSESMEAKKKL